MLQVLKTRQSKGTIPEDSYSLHKKELSQVTLEPATHCIPLPTELPRQPRKSSKVMKGKGVSPMKPRATPTRYQGIQTCYSHRPVHQRTCLRELTGQTSVSQTGPATFLDTWTDCYCSQPESVLECGHEVSGWQGWPCAQSLFQT